MGLQFSFAGCYNSILYSAFRWFNSARGTYILLAHPASMVLAAMGMTSVLQWILKYLIKYLTTVLWHWRNKTGALQGFVRASFFGHSPSSSHCKGMTFCAGPFKKILLLLAKWFAVRLALISFPAAFVHLLEQHMPPFWSKIWDKSLW